MDSEIFYIYRKDGSLIKVGGTDTNPEYLCIHELQLDDTFLGQKQVTITIKSPIPIEWKGQEYIILDDDKYSLKYEPSMSKQARKKTYGEAFVYENVILQSVTDETTRVKFQDYVLEDNNIHYSSMPTVYFYGTVKDLAMRIQANLDRVYKDDEKWTVELGDDLPTTEKQKTYQNVTVWDAITDIWNIYKVLFYTKGRTLYIGSGASTVPHDFKYGIGNGLKSLKKETSEDNEIITRLHVYGSQKNLPYRYYNKLGKHGKYTMPVYWISDTQEKEGATYSPDGTTKYIEINVKLGVGIRNDMFTTSVDVKNTLATNTPGFSIGISIDGYECNALITYYDSSDIDDEDGYRRGVVSISNIGTTAGGTSIPNVDLDEFNALYDYLTTTNPTNVVVLSGADFEKTPTDMTTQYGGILLDSLYLPNLMLPPIRVDGDVTVYYDVNFKEVTDTSSAVYRMIKTGNGGKDMDIYLESIKGIEQFGVLEGNVTFDNDSDTDFEDLVDDENGIYPNLGTATDGSNEIVSATQLTDAGVYDSNGDVSPATFDIVVKPGFNPNLYKISGETMQVSFKSGALIGRTFDIGSCSDNGDGTYTLTCNRVADDSIGLAFPNSSYNVQAGDKFVFLGIELPDEYIQAAEIRLLNAGLAYLANYDHTQYTYTPELDNIFLARTENKDTRDALCAGATFWFTDEDVNGTSEDEAITIKLPISKLTMKIGSSMIREYEVTLADTPDIDSDFITRTVNSVSNSFASVGGSSSIDEGALKVMGSRMFLSKTTNDTAQGIITFLKGLKIGSDGKYYIDANGKAALMNLIVDLISAGEIRTEYLTVTKAAHFFKLIVDEMRSTSGTIINTAANCIIDKVEAYDADGNPIEEDDTDTDVSFWRCYWKAKDGDGKQITNQWEKDDQAIVWTCNLAEGTSYDASNNYWWRLVEGVSSSPVSTVIDGEAYECHYIDVSNTTYDNGEYIKESGVPAVGDNVAQLGNRTDKERQGAIIFAAYNTPDVGLVSPSFAQYVGITDFNLSSHRWTWFARNGNKIRGNFEVSAGMGGNSYTHYAYSDSLDYSDDLEWVKGDMGGKRWKYKGIVATTEQSDDDLTFNDYSWEEIFYSPVYDAYLSQYADNIVVDAEGNVIGGLWKELSYTDSKGNAVTDKLYTISSALFVTKNGVPLLETDDDVASEGYYRIASVDCYECTYSHVNGGGFAITSISNCHDGVSDTAEEIDFDLMRLMYRCELKITIELEGKDEIRIISMPVVINHSNEAYITTDLDNSNAMATYNTNKKKWLGIDECVTKITKKHGTDELALTGINIRGATGVSKSDGVYTCTYDGMTIKYSLSTGKVWIDKISTTTPRVSNITIISTCKYAGISYENEKIWSVVIRNGVFQYDIHIDTPQSQIVTFAYKDGSLVADSSKIIPKAYYVGEDETHTDISSKLSEYSVALYYSTDGGTTKETYSGSITPEAKNYTITFYLIGTDGYVWDSEDVQVVCEAVSVTDTIIDYQIGASESTVPSGDWQVSPIPTVTDEKPYLWTRKRTFYNNGKIDYEYNHSGRKGEDGIQGEDGYDAWSVKISAESITVPTKIENNETVLDLSNTYVTIQAYHGDTLASVSSIGALSKVNCSATSEYSDASTAKIILTGVDKKTYTYSNSATGASGSVEVFADAGSISTTIVFTDSSGNTYSYPLTISFTCVNGSRFASFKVEQDRITSRVGAVESKNGELEGNISEIDQEADHIGAFVTNLTQGASYGIQIATDKNSDGSYGSTGSVSIYADHFNVYSPSGSKLLSYDSTSQSLNVVGSGTFTGAIYATSGTFGKNGTIKLNDDGSVYIGTQSNKITIDSNGSVSFAIADIQYTITDADGSTKTVTLAQATGLWIYDNSSTYMHPTANIQMGSRYFYGGFTSDGGITFSNITSGTRGITGIIGSNDGWRIVGGASGENAGYLEIATADDATEPIYVRQYGDGQGAGFVTASRSLTLLDASGNTYIPNNLGIGVESPTYKLQVSGGAYISGHTVVSSIYASRYGEFADVYITSDNSHIGGYLNISRQQIYQGNEEDLTISTDSGYSVYIESDSLVVNGNIYASGGITAKSSSDLRLKEVVPEKVDYTQKLLSLGEAFDYYYNEVAKSRKEGYRDDERHTGLAWQRVKGVIPTACGTSEDGYGYINYISPDVIGTTIGALQQSIGRIERLEQENNELRARLEALERRLA